MFFEKVEFIYLSSTDMCSVSYGTWNQVSQLRSVVVLLRAHFICTLLGLVSSFPSLALNLQIKTKPFCLS